MSDRPLTDDEAALVFRRATEVEVELASHRVDGWDLGQLEAVGREVGITPDAIRRAVAEVRLGPPPVELTGRVVCRWRIVPADPSATQAALATWLHDQLLEPVRDRPGQAVFDRRSDDDAERRRQRDGTGRIRLKRVERVTLAAGGAPGGGTVVRIEAQLRGSRARQAIVSGGGVVATKATGVAVIVAATPLSAAFLLGVSPLLAAGGAAWGWWRSGDIEDRLATEVGLALDGALDRLER